MCLQTRILRKGEEMLKVFGALLAVLALCTPVANATHCNVRARVVERVVVDDYDYDYGVQQVRVLVPHNKLVVEQVFDGYDSQPLVVERVVERQRILNDYPVRDALRAVVSVPARIVNRVRKPVRVRQRIVKREVVEVQRIKNRNVVRERILSY